MTGIQREKPWPRDPVTGVILGAESFTTGNGSHAILFLHGWTSTPRELRFLAQKFADAGFYCQGPLLRGHGTRITDLAPLRFHDFLFDTEKAFDDLAARHPRVTVCGLSMGGLLGLQLALKRPVANLILIAPFLEAFGSTFGLPNRLLIGRVPLPAIMAKQIEGPILDPVGAKDHISYHAMPTKSMISVVAAARKMADEVCKVKCPTLIFHSIKDTTSDYQGTESLMRHLGSEDKTLVAFNRGNHVLTLDYPRPQLETQAVQWLKKRA